MVSSKTQKNVLALISSAGHYYTLLEYLYQAKKEKADCHLLFFFKEKNTPDYKFYEQYIKNENWISQNAIELWDTRRNLLSNLQKIIKYHFVVNQIKSKKYDEIICSQINIVYMTHICHVTESSRLIALDEGNAVFREIEDRKRNKEKGVLTRWDYAFMGLQYKLLPSVTYFTSYNIEPLTSDNIIRCQYGYARSFFQKKKIIQDRVLIIGTSFVEDNMLTEKYNNDLLIQIATLFKGKEVLYYPHRREQQRQLIFITNTLGFKIVPIRKPIELELLDYEELSYTIASFYSAASMNLKKSFPDLNFICFKFNLNNLLMPQYINTINTIYQEYENAGINVIQLQ